MIVYDDIEKNQEKKYHDLYFFTRDFKNTLGFDYNCNNDELKKFHRNRLLTFKIFVAIHYKKSNS